MGSVYALGRSARAIPLFSDFNPIRLGGSELTPIWRRGIAAADFALLVVGNSDASSTPRRGHIPPYGIHLYIKDGGKVFGLARPIITVVQPAQSIMGKHATRA